MNNLAIIQWCKLGAVLTLLFLCPLCHAADSPRYPARVVCFNGALDRASFCASTSPPLDAASRATNEMTCGFPGKVSDLQWEFLKRDGAQDVYQFKRTFSADAPAASMMTKIVKFSDRRVIVFQDADQAIVIEPPKADELRRTNSPVTLSSTNHYAILPTSEGPALLKQCSRATPQNVTNYWTPSTSQIAEMEKRLPVFLRKSGFKRPSSDFCGQCIGFISNGKQLIYVNAFPRPITTSSEHADWHTAAIIICDGGSAFWGVVFDPADNTFHDFETNGFA